MTAEQERAAVVAWLRRPSYRSAVDGWRFWHWLPDLFLIAAGKALADAIEAGAHLPGGAE